MNIKKRNFANTERVRLMFLKKYITEEEKVRIKEIENILAETESEELAKAYLEALANKVDTAELRQKVEQLEFELKRLNKH